MAHTCTSATGRMTHLSPSTSRRCLEPRPVARAEETPGGSTTGRWCAGNTTCTRCSRSYPSKPCTRAADGPASAASPRATNSATRARRRQVSSRPARPTTPRPYRSHSPLPSRFRIRARVNPTATSSAVDARPSCAVIHRTACSIACVVTPQRCTPTSPDRKTISTGSWSPHDHDPVEIDHLRESAGGSSGGRVGGWSCGIISGWTSHLLPHRRMHRDLAGSRGGRRTARVLRPHRVGRARPGRRVPRRGPAAGGPAAGGRAAAPAIIRRAPRSWCSAS